ncbi:hypothetical protein OPV22_006112 [Ensete ventricosum]|uniref:Secreted protein n=1 Tax=Ensete ventricosum TaxID=4639 RepID=A0AAV8Q4R1_ENSVE|nr:hypothetical protein OPV22_006112 [Ensete ventricosum]
MIMTMRCFAARQTVWLGLLLKFQKLSGRCSIINAIFLEEPNTIICFSRLDQSRANMQFGIDITCLITSLWGKRRTGKKSTYIPSREQMDSSQPTMFQQCCICQLTSFVWILLVQLIVSKTI